MERSALGNRVVSNVICKEIPLMRQTERGMVIVPAVRFCFIGLMAVLVLFLGCRPSSTQPLDRKSAAKLVHEMTVDSPWIRIPAGMSVSPTRNAKAFQAYRRLVKGGILRCDSEFADCVVGPRGKTLIHEGTVGIKVTIGLLIADDVSVVRLIDRNSASATVTLRFRPNPVFTEFRSDLIAIMEAHGDAFVGDQIAGDNLATAQFHRSDGKWHLERIEPLGRSGAAFRRVAQLTSQPPVQATTNLAQMASVFVSSEDTSTDHTGIKAIDGLVDDNPADSATEWLARNEREGAWIKLTWTTPVQVWEVILHGRSNPDDNIRSGTLTFSDGSSINVGQFRKDGSGLRVQFSPRMITWLQFRVTSAVGSKTGLAEIEVLGAPVPEGDVSGLR
jgi:hypothetical protein